LKPFASRLRIQSKKAADALSERCRWAASGRAQDGVARGQLALSNGLGKAEQTWIARGTTYGFQLPHQESLRSQSCQSPLWPLKMPATTQRSVGLLIHIIILSFVRLTASLFKKVRFPLLCSVLVWAEALVPGVDFRAIRELISMADILELIGFEPNHDARNGGLRGPCPIHGSRSGRSRSFVVNVKLKVYRCFTCGSAGNHLDLYAAFSRQRVYQAALDLCAKLHCQVPWVQHKR
jgi:CHC2 zinc finger